MGRPKGSKNKVKKQACHVVKAPQVAIPATAITLTVSPQALNPREEGRLLADALYLQVPAKISTYCVAEILGKLSVENDPKVSALAQQLQVAYLSTMVAPSAPSPQQSLAA